MQLTQYPKAISNQQTKLVNMRKDLRVTEEAQKVLLASIKAAVAIDPTLKNETVRKAAELELMQKDPDLQLNSRTLAELKEAIALEEIALELLLNEFAVLKIEARERTATLMSQAA